MDYQKHYNLLCERAKNRTITDYTERHHIVPKCLGGSNDKENLVFLTPEEHYVAHQLLTKIYPNHRGLVWAAIQMTGHSKTEQRNNKLYGWLRRKYSYLAKQRTGEQNGSFGKYWYHNPETEEVVKCSPEEVPNGFIRGRTISEIMVCSNCGKEFRKEKKSKKKYCSYECRIEALKRTLKENNKAKYKAEYFWDLFKKSNCKSLNEFVRTCEEWPHSLPALTKLFVKYIPDYEKRVGKSKQKS